MSKEAQFSGMYRKIRRNNLEKCWNIRNIKEIICKRSKIVEI